MTTTHLSGVRQRLALVVALSTLIGVLAAALAGGVGQASSELEISAAATHVLIDVPSPSIVHRRADPEDVGTLVKRAELLGRVMITPPVLERIARRSGVPPDRVAGQARVTASVPLALTEPNSEQRAAAIVSSTLPYRIDVQARPTMPILDVYSQAPSTPEAVRLANASVPALRDYLQSRATAQGVPYHRLVRLRQLGGARGGPVNKGAGVGIALLAFVVGFALACGALLCFFSLRRGGLARLRRGTSTGEFRDEADSAAGDWPRTTRVLPWMLAGFLAILWLVPFNEVELNASLPIDLKLDRLVLPFIVVVWVVAVVAGGRVAPRLRFTWIHVALAAFVASAFLSVVLDARYLNQTLELDLSLKKLPLLVSYVSLFVIVASAVRRTEVRAFLTYTLALAVVCAAGVIWEYRFKTNPFNDLTDRLLPGFFSVGVAESAAVDHIGRRLVRGPAEVGLEAVTMLSIALPIALVEVMRSKRWRERILFGLAACALIAAMFATYRKSALLAPVAVFLTLAYFRRRELLKLAPLGLVLVVIVSSLSPGALGSTVSQFIRPDRLSVPTVSDRSSDYDAVRPDVWTHVAFGRGWGSYDHRNYRILDSEILLRTIETGVLGLLAFLFIGLSVILSTRAAIASGDPRWAPTALVGAAAAAAFLVVSTLYDVLSFPHATYIFLYTAGLVAVVLPWRRDAMSEFADGEDDEQDWVRRDSPRRELAAQPARAQAG